MDKVLDFLLHLPTISLWLIFLAENAMITFLVLTLGKRYNYTAREWKICIITNLLNTVVTYTGFLMWKHGVIAITTDISLSILWHFLLLFFAMDLLMFIFHYIVHKTFLFKAIHQLHHQSVDPTPIDLFVLHPVETMAFGSLWLVLLCCYKFNIYAISAYLIINVLFGLTGHLGIEPLSEKFRSLPLIKYLGTSTFHHHHHQDVQHNFGFYTSIWDRLLGTYKSSIGIILIVLISGCKTTPKKESNATIRVNNEKNEQYSQALADLYKAPEGIIIVGDLSKEESTIKLILRVYKGKDKNPCSNHIYETNDSTIEEGFGKLLIKLKAKSGQPLCP